MYMLCKYFTLYCFKNNEKTKKVYMFSAGHFFKDFHSMSSSVCKCGTHGYGRPSVLYCLLV